MKLTKTEQQRIIDWVFASGRDLDIARYNYHFLNEDKMMVLHTLSIYQNKDGGFGLGLINDSMNQSSTYFATAEALRIMVETGFDKSEENEIYNLVFNKTFRYLQNCKEKYFPLTDKKNNKFPGSSFLKAGSKESTICPSATIYGSLIVLLKDNNPYHKIINIRIEQLLKDYLEKTFDNSEVSKNELKSMSFLLKILKEKQDVSVYLNKFSNDLNVFEDYDKACINNNLVPLNEEVVNSVIDNRLKVGLWNHQYDWGSNAANQEIAEIKEISKLALDNLLILRNYNRLE